MRQSLPFLFLCVWLSASAMAQTGRIAGTVTDAATGEGLPGVNVIIEGTTIGATTSSDGFFSIINVRPGIYVLRASFIGYAPMVVENVNVDINLTTEINFALREAAVGLQEVVVTSEAPIIQRDIAGSERNIAAEEIRSGRYQSVANVLVADVSVNDISNYNDRPRIRGSNYNESLFIVDGISQGDPLNRLPNFRVNLDAVEEMKVQTGGFNAEYGNVRSGVIEVVTKEGGTRYSGSVNLQYSPPGLKNFGPGIFDWDSPLVQPFVNPEFGAFEGGNSFFKGWNDIAAGLAAGVAHKDKPMELYARYLWLHRSQDAIDELKKLQDQGIVQFAGDVDPDNVVFQQTGVIPDYNVSATFGGPLVPGWDPVRFFLSYDRQVVEYAYRFPERAYSDHNARGKINIDLASGMRLNLHGLFSRQRGGDGEQGPGIGGFISSNPFAATGDPNKLWYPDCAVPGYRDRQIYGAQFTHALNPNTFYELNLLHDRVDYHMDQVMRNTAPVPGTCRDRNGDGKIDPLRECVNSSSGTAGTGVDNGRIGTEAEAEARRIAGQEGWDRWRDWALIRIGDHWYDESPKGWGPVNWRDITGYYRMESCNARTDETYTRGLEFNGSITSQVNRANMVKAGFMVKRIELDAYYDADDPSVNGGTVWDYSATPWTGAVFAQDKLEFRGFVANVGLRADWLVTGEFPLLLDGCSLGDEALDCGSRDLRTEGPYSDFLLRNRSVVNVTEAGLGVCPPDDPNTLQREDLCGRIRGSYEVALTDSIPTGRAKHLQISPRIGVSHPISTVAKIFFNYGHFYQWPTIVSQYQISMNPRDGYRVNNLGNPIVEPERTIAYELGYEHNLFDSMLLRFTGYYKDINNEINNIAFYPLGYGGGSYTSPVNNRFRDVRGAEVFLELRRNVIPFVSGWASLNYMVESQGLYGYDRYFENPSQQARFVNNQVSDPDVRPIFRTSLNFHTRDDMGGPSLGETALLGGFNLNILYTWQRGPQFTWNPAGFPLVENNVRWRPYQRFDLRLNKTLFSKGTVESVFYLDVSNLLNNRNMTIYQGGIDPNSRNNNWAWDGHQWFRNQFRDYMYSLGYDQVNQTAACDPTDLESCGAGNFENPKGKPGDWCEEGASDCEINMPDFTPWTFLGRRDIYFGIKLYF